MRAAKAFFAGVCLCTVLVAAMLVGVGLAALPILTYYCVMETNPPWWVLLIQAIWVAGLTGTLFILQDEENKD